jgi:putative hydrolase of the HAD superfamily
MHKKSYEHLFFDLDHTLWDFSKNSRETLEELYHDFQLHEHIPDFETFFVAYHQVNDEKWSLYRKGLLSKEMLRATRFLDTLRRFHLDQPDMAIKMDQQYLERSPYKTHLLPGAIEVLGALYEKHPLHIVTNGFIQVQQIKLVHSGLRPFFKHAISSEEIGVNKPDPKIFTHALRQTGASRKTSLMIGDNWEADVVGARNVGIDQVFFNPNGIGAELEATYQIKELRELLNILG